MEPLKNTRMAALAAGDMLYATGKPCPHRHVDVRYTKTGQCKSCVRASAKAHWVNKSGKTRQRWDTASIVPAFIAQHGGRYDYSSVVYTTHKAKIRVRCAVHGGFLVSPDNHLQGKGCGLCERDRRGSFGGLTRLTTSDFIASARGVWGDFFDYSKVSYVDSHTKVSIRCPIHGVFSQTPTNHLTGRQACSKCNHMKSAPEQALGDWLESLGVVVVRRVKLFLPDQRELDIYLPEHKLAIEYCGMYWHSHKNPEEEANDKHKHWSKHKACEAQGIRLITLYETEWQERKPVIKRLLRAATGKLRGRLMARKCDLAVVSVAEAKVFFEAYHPQGGAGGGVYYGLRHKGRLVACMRFALGINDRGAAGKNKLWTLSRYATRFSVAGGAGRLLRAFQEEYDYPSIKSFSDNRLFSGGMYEKLGFVLDEESLPDYAVWSHKCGLRPKTHYQRREIPQRLLEHGSKHKFDPETDPRTEQEVTYAIGARRIYDCGKKKWVLDARARLA